MNVILTSASRAWARQPIVRRISQYIELGEADLDALRRVIEGELLIKKRQEIVIDGDPYRKLCFVEEGFAARYKLLRNGKRQIINVVLPGDVIGIPSSFLDHAAWSVNAVTDLKLQVCSIEAYTELCLRAPRFGLVLAWLAVQELATCAEHITNTGRRTPIERLANFLLELHRRLAMVDRAEEMGFALPFSQEVIGDTLGLSVPHLNRMFARLRKEGLITMQDHRIRFTDLRALQTLGHYQPLRVAPIPLP